MPSSSISARAAARWSRVAMRTERPARLDRPRLSAVPPASAPRRTVDVAPHRKRSVSCGALVSASWRHIMSGGTLLIKADEITERDGIRHVAGIGERVEAERLFEPGHED